MNRIAMHALIIFSEIIGFDHSTICVNFFSMLHQIKAQEFYTDLGLYQQC